MDKFSTIPFFVTVVETGSFSAAAQKLSMTKSAVSKRIVMLEDDLGVKLLHRTTRKISLTEAGTTYYDYVRAAANLVFEGHDAVSQMQSNAHGTLKITLPMVFGRLHVSPILSRFMRSNPHIQLQVTMDDRDVDLVGDGFDIGIRIGSLADSSLIARKLSTCSSVICASPRYLQRAGMPKNLTDLYNHNCMAYTGQRGGMTWRVNGPSGEERFTPKGNFNVNNSEALYDALLADLGICQMPKFIVAPALTSGKLVTILDEYKLPEHHIFVVYPQRKYMPEKVRCLLDFFIENFGKGSQYQKEYEW